MPTYLWSVSNDVSLPFHRISDDASALPLPTFGPSLMILVYLSPLSDDATPVFGLSVSNDVSLPLVYLSLISDDASPSLMMLVYLSPISDDASLPLVTF
ncbi:hypothetical protein RRG08_054492 [Elysia crispata]|uniref:Uncharacterized protein n=1 Tax=Elysia crispata TaxID=231223 RepID=A0AAE1DM63_9GAST|nr:hypothetical protein RRG08_054492 [Elysia crispata]